MELINKELIEAFSIPQLYGTEDIVAEEKIVYLKYIEPNTGWVWYLCEIDYDDEYKRAFGYVVGGYNGYKEWGYFSLVEMEEIYTIVRDESFEPMKFNELQV